MHRYHAMLVEPWDGPAGLVFTDGVTCGATLDRNGLRPLRVAVATADLVAVSSEAGAVPLPEGVSVRRARLGPGQLLSVDPTHGLRFDAELDARPRARAGRTRTGSPSRIERRRAGRARRRARRRSARAARAPRLHARGAEPDAPPDRAEPASDPVYSMGDDAPIAPLAGRARPLASYFRQRFAQVTNPAIDHYRERTVMSVATLLGARAPLDTEGPLPPLVALPGVPRHAGRARRARAGRGSTRPSPRRRASAARSSASRTPPRSSSRAARRVVCLSDREAGGDRAPIPSLLALAAVARPPRRARACGRGARSS